MVSLSQSARRPPESTGDVSAATLQSNPVHAPLEGSRAAAGEYPYTRGIHPEMYRERLWTMRQFAGFGTARQTNARFHRLLECGQTGLSTAFDLPTLMGLDSDEPRAAGEVGRLGVAIDTIDDLHELFAGIRLDETSVSMTINAPACVLMAFYLQAARERGNDWSRLRGTIQNDILKEFHAQNEIVYPPAASVRLVIDLIEFCTHQVPLWNPVSISGYHIREAGATATQELAFTLADGRHYVEEALRRGLEIDAFAPRLSFFFNAHNDLFEEVAKFRAARQLWAELMRETYHARVPASWKLRFHAQTAGCTLQAPLPELNLVRVAYQALAAVLGGCQSLHTNSLDETWALPSEHAALLALRTQQVLAHETGVAAHVDPLGGSHLVESLTQQFLDSTIESFERIASQGGMLAAIRSGYFRREIADAAYREHCEFDRGNRVVVGVNRFTDAAATDLDVENPDPELERDQVRRLQAARSQRQSSSVAGALSDLRLAASRNENVFPALLDAAAARATIGEISTALADVFGRQSLREL